MIVLRNVEKYFEHGPTKSFVLRRVNAEIKEGEFVSIMGPSGAGKSTLLHLIGMHDSAWTGEYHFLDQPVHKLDKNKRNDLRNRNIGFVFSPKALKGFTLQVDYSNLFYKGLPAGIGGNNIVSSVNALGAASPYFSAIAVG